MPLLRTASLRCIHFYLYDPPDLYLKQWQGIGTQFDRLTGPTSQAICS